MTQDWRNRIVVALGAGDARVVAAAVGVDARGMDLETPRTLRTGEEMTVQIRCAGRRQLIEARVRVEPPPKTAGANTRLVFIDPAAEGLQAVHSAARELGLMATPTRPPTGPLDEAVVARPGETIEAVLVDLQAPREMALALGALLDGALMLPLVPAPEVGARVLLRLILPEGRPLWLPAHVVYRGLLETGAEGIGVALDPPPEPLRRELRRLRGA